ncbi:similar to sigma factor SigB regulation protein [gamma proteobacterium HdN1]|nr:similar to sigma factor SigB regulation protein [gamma proteobacterium HdN1]
MRSSFALKLGVAVTLLTMAVAAIALSIFYSFSRQAILDEMSERLKDLTHTGSFLFQEQDRVMIAELRRFVLAHTLPRTAELLKIPENETREALPADLEKEYMESAEYQHIVQILRSIQRGSSERVKPLHHLKQDVGNTASPPNIFWAYLMTSVPESPDHRIVMFLGDSNYEQIDYNNDGHIEGYEEGNPIGNLYAGDYDIFGKPYDTGEISVSPGWYSDKWGTFMTAVVPIKNAQDEVIATLGLDYLVVRQSERLHEILFISVLVFGGSVLLAVLFSFFLAYRINKPIRILSQGAERIGRRDFKTVINVRSNDEFGFLACTLNSMTAEMRAYQSGLEKLVDERTAALAHANNEIHTLYESLQRENESLGAELDLARRLQTNLLPVPEDIAPLQKLEIAFSSEPAPQVGGDYLDIIPNTHGGAYFGIGDVSGHGLETGLFMMMMRTAIRSLITCGTLDLVNTLVRLNEVAYNQARHSGTQHYMTGSLLEYDGGSQYRLTGQHEDVIIVRSERSVEILDTGSLGVPIGIIHDIASAVSQLTLRLAPDQLLLLYTNGLIDAQNLSGQSFGIERITEIARAHFGKSAHEVHRKILESLAAFSEGVQAQDDVSIIVIRQKS